MAEIRKQPIETADYTGLIARYEAEIAKLDDTPANRMFRGRLQQRLLWLQGAVEAQNVRKKLAESSQAVAASQSSIGERMADVARNRQYSIVGRLTTSTVYDGQRLPRMYRIQAVGGGPSPRTLGYLKPDAMPGLESKIGQVVGVVGSAKIDSALGLNVITPSRVDVLEAAQVPGAQPPSAPPAAPPASQPTTPPGN
jgi:hypothetical protein